MSSLVVVPGITKDSRKGRGAKKTRTKTKPAQTEPAQTTEATGNQKRKWEKESSIYKRTCCCGATTTPWIPTVASCCDCMQCAALGQNLLYLLQLCSCTMHNAATAACCFETKLKAYCTRALAPCQCLVSAHATSIHTYMYICIEK